MSLDETVAKLDILELALAHVLLEELGDALELVESLLLKLADTLDAALRVCALALALPLKAVLTLDVTDELAHALACDDVLCEMDGERLSRDVTVQRALMLVQPVDDALARRVPLPDEHPEAEIRGLRLTGALPLVLELMRGENESLEEPLEEGLARALPLPCAEAVIDADRVCVAVDFPVAGALELAHPLMLRVTRAEREELCEAEALPLKLPPMDDALTVKL